MDRERIWWHIDTELPLIRWSKVTGLRYIPPVCFTPHLFQPLYDVTGVGHFDMQSAWKFRLHKSKCQSAKDALVEDSNELWMPLCRIK